MPMRYPTQSLQKVEPKLKELSDKIDQHLKDNEVLELAVDRAILARLNNDESHLVTAFTEMIDNKLEEYDPTDYRRFDSSVQDLINDTLNDSRVIRDSVREVIENNVTVELSVER